VLVGSLGKTVRDIGVPDVGLGLEAGPEPEPDAGYSTASRRGSLAERAM